MSDERPHKSLKRERDHLDGEEIWSDEYSSQETNKRRPKQEQPEEGGKLDESLSTLEDSHSAEKNDTSSAKPNATSHCDIIAEHYNTIEEKGLKARGHSRIFHMRNFNNWIKSVLISSFLDRVKEEKSNKGDNSGLYVLDMGCGKGGDLFKWKDGAVTHVVFADLAQTSVQQCEQRYRDLKRKLKSQHERNSKLFTAEFIAADCTRERLQNLYKEPSMKFDLVSCQFAFHYCWESLPQAECMLRNASECLKIGGYFVGTCPSASTIMSRLRKAGCKEFGNSVYSVSFENEYPEGSTPPLFGAKYHFKLEGVVDCPEFLVHFNTFRRLAERWGFCLYVKQPFHSFYQSTVGEKEHLAKLLPKMTALEAYPPREDSKLAGAEEEYSSAREKCKSLREENPHDDVCVGTLSKSEWEAVTLYLVFAFKKLREPDLEY